MLKGESITRIPRYWRFDSPLCLELLAELERRARDKSDEHVASFQIVGSLHQASATLSWDVSDAERRATLCLRYPEDTRGE